RHVFRSNRYCLTQVEFPAGNVLFWQPGNQIETYVFEAYVTKQSESLACIISGVCAAKRGEFRIDKRLHSNARAIYTCAQPVKRFGFGKSCRIDFDRDFRVNPDIEPRTGGAD